jgi:hypothetical protein
VYTFIIFVAAMMMLTLSSRSAPCSDGNKQIALTYAQESGAGSETVTFAVSAHLSSVTQKEETVYIDYEKLRLYRYSRKNNSCESFPLNDPAKTPGQPAGGEEQARQDMIKILGSFRVITSGERQKIQGYACRKKHILFAADLSSSQVAVSPEISRFGQNFTESTVSYWVTTEVQELDTLLYHAGTRHEIFQANPLLRQVDVTGLLEPLQGLPVMIEKKTRQDAIQLTLMNISRKSSKDRIPAVPEECLKSAFRNRN